MRFLNDVTFCPVKGGRTKIVGNHCLHCGAPVHVWPTAPKNKSR